MCIRGSHWGFHKMKVNCMRLSAAFLVAVSLTGCATITRGTREKFYVNSEPSGADVEMTNGLRCKTPCKIKIPRKSEFVVKVMKDGFEPAEVAIHGKVKGGGTAGFVGNALLGGLIGGAVDVSTGSALNLVPNPVSVTLKPVAVVTPADAAAPALVPAAAADPVAAAPAAAAAVIAAPAATPAVPAATGAAPAVTAPATPK
jgi:PEGA domain